MCLPARVPSSQGHMGPPFLAPAPSAQGWLKGRQTRRKALDEEAGAAHRMALHWLCGLRQGPLGLWHPYLTNGKKGTHLKGREG